MLALFFTIYLCVAAYADDFDTIFQATRRDAANAALAYSSAPTASISEVPTWISSIKADGSWSDIDYTAGCSADLNVWKAEEHWARVIGTAQAWSGLNSAAPSGLANSTSAFDAAVRGLDCWFKNDYTDLACLQANGGGSCPCGTSGLWNKYWFFQGIGVPTLASRACLILSPGNLTANQRMKCLELGIRGSNCSSSRLDAKYQTGSNLVNILQDVINAALYSRNNTLLQAAYPQAMATFDFSDATGADGQHRDGSHLAHTSQVYNGAYGREFLKSFAALQLNAAGTQLQASSSIQESIATLIKGSDWQIFTDSQGSLRWDISVIGRYVASPLSPPGSPSLTLQFDPAVVRNATSSFSSSNDVSTPLDRLSQSMSAQPLLGNKGFWAGDYMTKLYPLNKMISSRSRHAETVGGTNPYGYHLNQGLLWSYVTGGEYTNITGAWDWYLIPGSTVLYHYPTLDITWISVTGKKPFVGVTSDGTNGVSVMDYIEPHDASISYRRVWFFYDDMVINVIANATRLTTSSSAPIVTVLDQRLSDGSTLLLDGRTQSANIANTATKTVYHGGNGYYAMNGGSFDLTAKVESRTGNWSELSVTSAGAITQEIFTAYHTMPQGSTIAYAFLPKISSSELATRATSTTGVKLINSTGVIGIAGNQHLALSFWPGSATSQQVQMPAIGWKTSGSITVSTTNPIVLMLDVASGYLAIRASDPTQLLASAIVTLKADTLKLSCDASTSYCTQLANGVTLKLSFPSGAYAGSTLSIGVNAV